MERIKANLKLQTPFGALISGPSQSGKSSLLFNILSDPSLIFDHVPQRIVYVYGIWQELFDSESSIEFVSSLDKVLDDDFFDTKIRNCLIIDDKMEEMSSHSKASRLFSKYIHHSNVSVFFVVQNLFRQGKAMRDIVLNCQYIILFKSNRDVGQIQLLGRQLGLKHLVPSYEICIKEPFSYLFIDLHPRTPALLQLQTNLFGYRKVFLPK